MQAYMVTEPGRPPQLNENVEIPVPLSHQVLLKIEACALNFADLLMIKGTYQDMPQTPFTLGMEVAGTIVECGSAVKNLAAGDRVALINGHGGLAEYGAFDAEKCRPIPDIMSFEDAAAFQIAYGTSHLALIERANLQPHENLVVLGASGGVGLTAIEIGKAVGARVIAVARGAEKLEIARKAGADIVLDSDSADLRNEVKSLGGADVVYDPVGGEQFRALMRACNPLARILAIGFASGDVPQIPANILMVKNISVIGFYWGGYATFAPERQSACLETLFRWYEEGRVAPHVCDRFALDQAGQALEVLSERKSTGKIVICPHLTRP